MSHRHDVGAVHSGGLWRDIRDALKGSEHDRTQGAIAYSALASSGP